MGNILTESIARNIRLPEKTLMGRYAKNMMVKKNSLVEENAAKLLKIEPHHKVLEIGFGPGVGLRTAYQYIKDGPGKVYGIDLSLKMVDDATRSMKTEIAAGKMDITLGNVLNLPYQSHTFDRVFHVNSFYFWPDWLLAHEEIYRVMKSKSLMVTALDEKRIEYLRKSGKMKYGKTDLIHYLYTLETTGFQDVHVEYHKCDGKEITAIFGTVNKQGDTS